MLTTPLSAAQKSDLYTFVSGVKFLTPDIFDAWKYELIKLQKTSKYEKMIKISTYKIIDFTQNVCYTLSGVV